MHLLPLKKPSLGWYLFFLLLSEVQHDTTAPFLSLEVRLSFYTGTHYARRMHYASCLGAAVVYCCTWCISCCTLGLQRGKASKKSDDPSIGDSKPSGLAGHVSELQYIVRSCTTWAQCDNIVSHHSAAARFS